MRSSNLAFDLAHTRVWLYDNSPRVKPRQAAYHVTAGAYADDKAIVLTSEPAQPWDPSPPLRMGPQRCLSSRETIERLAFVLPKQPDPMSEAISRALTRKREHEARLTCTTTRPTERPARCYLDHAPEPILVRTVSLAGDYIDDGSDRPSPEEARLRFKEMLVAVREAAVTGNYTPHTRDTKPRW